MLSSTPPIQEEKNTPDVVARGSFRRVETIRLNPSNVTFIFHHPKVRPLTDEKDEPHGGYEPEPKDVEAEEMVVDGGEDSVEETQEPPAV